MATTRRSRLRRETEALQNATGQVADNQLWGGVTGLLSGPTETILLPANEETFTVGQPVTTKLSCADSSSGPGIAICTDSKAPPRGRGVLDTSTVGNFA